MSTLLKTVAAGTLCAVLSGAGTYYYADLQAKDEKTGLQNELAQLRSQKEKQPAIAINDIGINPNADGTSATVSNNGQKIGDVTLSANQELALFKQTALSAYFTVKPVGIGGYIPYDTIRTASVYRYDFQTKDFTEIPIPHIADVSVSEAIIAYLDDNGAIVLADRDGKTIKEFTPNPKWSAFGEITISPNEQYVAYAGTSGDPDNESGALYSLEIASGEETEAAFFPTSVPYINGWKDGNTPR